MLKGTQAYIQTTFSTVGQGEILVLLYDGAIKFLTQAKEKIREKDAGAKGMLISKALDIINELDGSINMDVGGALAKNLHQLYFVCSTRLLRANLRMDTDAVDSVLRILTDLRNAYASIVNTPEAKAASAKIAAKLPATPVKMPRAVPVPKQTAAPVGMGHAQMQAAYAQGAVSARGATGAAAGPAAPVMQPVPSPAIQPSMPAVQPAVAAAEPSARPEPAMPGAPVNMDHRRSAAAARYGKIAQTIQ